MRLSEEHRGVRETTRRFADAEIRPIAADLDEEERFPGEVYAKMARLGLFGIGVPAPPRSATSPRCSYEGTDQIQRNIIARQLLA